MSRNTLLLMLVVLLLGILILREPRLARADEAFLGWLLKHTQTSVALPVPLTVVEIAQENFREPQGGAIGTEGAGGAKEANAPAAGTSPLEYALFLQSVLEFEPGVVAFENILRWRETEKEQEQIFLDQAMRVPKLLLAAELGPEADPDAPPGELRGFANVSGKRGDLPAFAGVTRHASEELRLISTPGFVNLPAEVTSSMRVPLLFLYRGEVIPSFALQAFLLWQRVTPAEVQVAIGSHIQLPQDRRIPIAADGTLLIDPNAGRHGRRLGLNELLLAAQMREQGEAGTEVVKLQDNVVLARTPDHPLAPPDVFAATIATLQGNKFLRRVSKIFDCVVLLAVIAAVSVVRRMDRFDFILMGIALSAAYCLVAVTVLSRWSVWLPGLLPLGTLWVCILGAFFFPHRFEATREVSIPPPIA